MKGGLVLFRRFWWRWGRHSTRHHCKRVIPRTRIIENQFALFIPPLGIVDFLYHLISNKFDSTKSWCGKFFWNTFIPSFVANCCKLLLENIPIITGMLQDLAKDTALFINCCPKPAKKIWRCWENFSKKKKNCFAIPERFRFLLLTPFPILRLNTNRIISQKLIALKIRKNIRLPTQMILNLHAFLQRIPFYQHNPAEHTSEINLTYDFQHQRTSHHLFSWRKLVENRLRMKIKRYLLSSIAIKEQLSFMLKRSCLRKYLIEVSSSTMETLRQRTSS